MTAEIIEKTDNVLRVSWWDQKLGFGELTLVWDEGIQDYILKAELMSIDTIIAIFQALKP